MADSTPLEPFPQIITPHHGHVRPEPAKAHTSGQRLRRKSSGLQGEPRGDATGPALATGLDITAYGIHRHPSTSERPRRSKRRRVKSFFKRWKNLSLRHTWVNPLILCLLVVVCYFANPSPSNPFHAALFLSYPLPQDDPNVPRQYGKGRKDFAFVAFYTIFLSFTREFIMQRFLRPLAWKGGIKSRGKQARFMEQSYTAIYFAVFGPYGLYVMSRSPVWYFNTVGMYQGFPHRTHEAVFKSYYLLQASYWAQQAIVLLLLLEKPRKDFKELVAHHIITLSLIGLSYRFHFTYIGIAIYITHDISDFFLATSKVLNYLDSVLVVPYFVIFLSAWTYLRHYLNLRILISMLPLPSPFSDSITQQLSTYSTSILTTLTDLGNRLFPHTTSLLTSFFTRYPQAQIINWSNNPPAAQFATIGPYTLDWAAQQYKCWISQWVTFGLLAALQCVNIFWLYLILRILWRIVVSFGADAEDDRSEYSDEEEEVEERQKDLEELRKEQADVHMQPLPEGKPALLLNGQPVSPAENGKAVELMANGRVTENGKVR